MIGKFILYGLAFVGALTMLGGGFIVCALVYFSLVEPMQIARQERKQHKTNLKALKRHWECVAVEEH